MPAARGTLVGRVMRDYQPAIAEERPAFSQEQLDAVELWRSDVWTFCTGTWPLDTGTGQKGERAPKPILWTEDKLAQRRRPFPRDYTYLRDCLLLPIFHAPRFDASGRPHKHRFVSPKPRQMFVTNGILAGCLWDVLFHEAVEWLVAKNKQSEAARFLKLRVRFMYNNLPTWFAGRTGPDGWPGYVNVSRKPAGEFAVTETGSRITAVARSFGESGEGVGETAKVLLDECIRLRNLGAVWDAVDAQAPVVVAVSAPPEVGQKVDPLSVARFRELCEDLEPGALTRTVLARAPVEALEMVA